MSEASLDARGLLSAFQAFVTEIALQGNSTVLVHTHDTEGTDQNAVLTTDAPLMLDNYRALFSPASHCVRGANLHARRGFAMAALQGDGEVGGHFDENPRPRPWGLEDGPFQNF